MNGQTASTGSQSLDELAEVIGEAAALELAWAYRGIKLYIPKDPEREPGIAAAIGEEAAAKLCEAIWRTTIYLPINVVLARKVRQLLAAGLTRKQVALTLHIGERRVYRLLKKPIPGGGYVRREPVDDRQLFLL